MAHPGQATFAAQPDFQAMLQRLHAGRYLQQMPADALREVLCQARFVELPADAWLIREGDASGDVYMLIEGSLAVFSRGKFILRLQEAGEVVGEMAAISDTPRSADVQAESTSQLLAFPPELFALPAHATQAPLFYVMFAHVLAEKLRLTTVQSLLRKDERVAASVKARVALVAQDADTRRRLLDALERHWPQARPAVFETRDQLLRDRPAVDLVISDLWDSEETADNLDAARHRLTALQGLQAQLLIVSRQCEKPDLVGRLLNWGVEECLEQPWRDGDLQRALLHLQERRMRQQQLDDIEQAADTDALTGLANRRRLDEFIRTLVETHPLSGKPFSLIIADIDYFKHYNDNFGHQAGDRALQAVAEVFRSTVRKGDLAARYGGEEFVVVLPHCDRTPAARIAEALRREVTMAPVAHRHQQPDGILSISVGIASFPQDAQDGQALLQRADARLYQAKSNGRNRVESG